MKKFWILILACLLIVEFAAAEETDWQDMAAEEIINEAFDEEGNLKPEYQEELGNFDLSDAPPELTSLIEGERSNIKVELENGEEVTIGIVVEDSRIEELQLGGVENPTSEITTSEETVKEILSSEDPAGEFSEAFAQGEIHYESKSPETFLKGLIINTIAFFLWLINTIGSFSGFGFVLVGIGGVIISLLFGVVLVLLFVLGVVVVVKYIRK